MISANEISSGSGAAGYYAKSFSQDGAVQADNYYVNESSQATWRGKGAELLGIEGKAVSKEDFVNYLDGKLTNPATGEVQDLAANSRGADRRAGWDFTVSASKSVSILALVAGDERVVEAHRTANDKAMGWLEEHASQIRIKDESGQNVNVPTGNLLWASVMHETSRENEPQLHSHNVITAATYDKEKETWRSLTNDELFALRSSADVIYKAALAKELIAAGYELEYTKDAVNFEIKGLTKEQTDAFSSRSKQIDAELTRRGYDPETASWESRQAAALDTRSPKNELPRDVVHEVWNKKAQENGMDLEALVAASKERAQSKAGNTKAIGEEQAAIALRGVSWAIEHLSEREQSFKVSDLERNAVEFGGGDIGDVKRAIATHMENRQIVAKPALENGSGILTTEQGITAERQLKANILAGKGNGRAIVSDIVDFNSELKTYEDHKTQQTGVPYKLSAEQVNAAKNILMHSDAIQGIQGEAGTGKTAALAFVREVAEGRGWRVVGVAVSGPAAKELQASSGIESQTLARMFMDRNVAKRQATAEISTLKADLAAIDKGSNGIAGRSETRRLTPISGNLNFGSNRYTFDKAKNEVFKPTNSLQGKLGSYLQDVSDRLKAREVGGSNGQTLGERLSMHLSSGAGYLGNAITTYQKVGVVEAVAARNSLYVVEGREELVAKLNTKQAELNNLRLKGNIFGTNTLMVMDEASMGGIKDLAKYTSYGNSIGARQTLQGDIKQHASVPAGRAFAQAQEFGMNVSVLQETKRFDKATENTKISIHMMKAGEFGKAMAQLDRTVVENDVLAKTVAKRYVTNREELIAKGNSEPKIGVVVVTNNDRKEINKEIHSALRDKGVVGSVEITKAHLDDPKLTVAQLRTVSMMASAKVDGLIFRRTYQDIGVAKGGFVKITGFDIPGNRILGVNEAGRAISINPEKYTDPRQQVMFSATRAESRVYSVGDQVEVRAAIKPNGQDIRNGSKGVIENISNNKTVVKWADESRSILDNKTMQFVDLGYARTSYKEQGATNDREIIALSKTGAQIYNKLAAYVSATRAKDNTELVTSDMEQVIKRAGSLTEKTTALDMRSEMQSWQPAQSMSQAIDSAIGVEVGRSEGKSTEGTKESAKEKNAERGREVEKVVSKGFELGI